jgi:3-oxoacyl-[acyl-carrier protein] reductase
MGIRTEDVAWITGGTSGIGRAIATDLARTGCRVVISGRSEETLKKIAQQIGVAAVLCDVTDESSVRQAHEEITSTFGIVSILINAAGISPFTTFSQTSVQEFDEVIATNLTGSFLTTRLVLPAMYAAQRGSIVQLLSIASIKAFAGGAAYIASKFGALGFINSLREEARKHQVKVMAVLPGATDTDAWDRESRETYRGRMMQPEDISQAVMHLLSQPDRMLTEEMVIRPIGGDL